MLPRHGDQAPLTTVVPPIVIVKQQPKGSGLVSSNGGDVLVSCLFFDSVNSSVPVDFSTTLLEQSESIKETDRNLRVFPGFPPPGYHDVSCPDSLEIPSSE